MWQLARWHGQPAMGGATSLCIASVSKGIVEMAARSRMSREVHVRSLWGTGGEIPPVYPAGFIVRIHGAYPTRFARSS